MARIIKSNISGTLDGLIYYTRKDSDQVYVRTKGGVSKKRILTDPKLERVRFNNVEFGGCASMAKAVRASYLDIAHVADIYLGPTLCALAKRIQKEDTVGNLGQRRISLSQYSRFLVGIELRKSRPLASLFGVELNYHIDRECGSATVEIPAFSSGFAFKVPNKHPYFRIIANLGVACDQAYHAVQKKYFSVQDRQFSLRKSAHTPWYPGMASVPEQLLKLDLDVNALAKVPLAPEETLILSFALEFAAMDPFGEPSRIKGEGAGRIVAVG